MEDKIRFTYPETNHTVILPDLLMVSEATLDRDLAEQPGLYAYYAALAVQTQGRRDRHKHELDIKRAQWDAEVRDTYAKVGRKITEDGVKAELERHLGLAQGKAQLLAWDEQAAMANAIKDAFYHRLEALKALAANMRIEMGQKSGM